MAGQQIQKRNGGAVATVANMLEKHKGQLQAALPQHVGTDRMIRIALTSIRRTPALQSAPPATLLGCIMSAAQLGLEIDNGLGHAYIVPFRNKGKPDAQLIVGYKGLVEMARRSGQISTIYAHCAHVDDRFEYELGLDPKLVHKPAGKALPSTKDAAIKSITHVYAVAKMKDGGVQFDVMATEEIEAIRARSKAGNSGPWLSDWPEMAKKTVLRRMSKLLPMSVEQQRAIARDEQIDAGITHDFSGEVEGTIEVQAEEPGASDEPDEADLPLPPEHDAEAAQ